MIKMLTIGDFEKIDTEGGKYYYRHRAAHSIEICLELCFAGFDVAIYRNEGEGGYDLLRPKQCTETGNYLLDPFDYHRTDADRRRAIDIANKLLISIN